MWSSLRAREERVSGHKMNTKQARLEASLNCCAVLPPTVVVNPAHKQRRQGSKSTSASLRERSLSTRKQERRTLILLWCRSGRAAVPAHKMNGNDKHDQLAEKDEKSGSYEP
jgi:hypothetical protein